MIVGKSCLKLGSPGPRMACQETGTGSFGCSRCRETPKAGISIVDHEIITLLRSFGTLKQRLAEKRAGICGLVLMRDFLLSGPSGAHSPWDQNLAVRCLRSMKICEVCLLKRSPTSQRSSGQKCWNVLGWAPSDLAAKFLCD